MTDEEKLQNTIECIEMYAKTLSRYCNDIVEAKNKINDPKELAKRLDLYMDGVRYNNKKISSCYKKLCDATDYDPEYE